MNRIDAILYINLKHRRDRKKHIEKELVRMGFKPSKIFRIDAILEPLCGHLGCGKSHIKALEYAQKQEWNRILIVEDDFTFIQTKQYINKELEKMFHEKWDVLMLSIGHKRLQKTKWNTISRVIAGTTTSGYLLNKTYIKTLLSNFRECVILCERELYQHNKKRKKKGKAASKIHNCTAIDQHWNKLQSKDIFYVFMPNLGTQNCGFSDNNVSLYFQKNYIERTK